MKRISTILFALTVALVILGVMVQPSSPEEGPDLYAAALEAARERLPDLQPQDPIAVDIPAEANIRLSSAMYEHTLARLPAGYRPGEVAEPACREERDPETEKRITSCGLSRDILGRVVLHQAELEGSNATVRTDWSVDLPLAFLSPIIFVHLHSNDGDWEVETVRVMEF